MDASAGISSGSRRSARTARVGRPPTIHVDDIIAAALELGLEDVTLKQIADHLGVAIATLYRHVAGRDELVRLAAFQLTLRRELPDAGAAHWSELATRYAQTLYASFLAEPQLIGELLKGRLGPHAEVDVLEQFMAAMKAHGFSELDSAQLFHALGMITIGAAAGAIGKSAADAGGTPWRRAMQRTLAERDADELKRVRRVLPVVMELDPIPWVPTLQRLLEGIAAARGEKLPKPSSGKTKRRAT
jgi:AcrR family transcriptional regulator